MQKYKLFLKLPNGSMRKSVFNSLRRFSEKKGVQTWLCQTDERCFSTAVRLFQGMADTLLSMLNPKSVIRISLCRTAKRNPLIFPI